MHRSICSIQVLLQNYQFCQGKVRQIWDLCSQDGNNPGVVWQGKQLAKNTPSKQSRSIKEAFHNTELCFNFLDNLLKGL